MTIGDRIPATRRPEKKQPPERPAPGRAQHTSAIPQTPTPTGTNQRAKTNTGDCVRHAAATAFDTSLPTAFTLTARPPCGHLPAPGPAVA